MISYSALFVIVLLLNNASRRTLAIVPIPTVYKNDSTACSLMHTLTYEHNYPTCFILTDSLTRFRIRLASQHPPIPQKSLEKCSINKLKIEIMDGCDENSNKLWPSHIMNESYNVNIEDSEIAISSKEVWGALRALETVLQMVYKDEFGGNVIFNGYVEDEPLFLHRGMLLDTGRNFMPVETLRKIIDSMAMVKMNVLHWHITDDQSFPFVSTAYPELSDKGAYHPQMCTYDEIEVTDLLEYARLRGVRIIPEFDTPAHTLSWGKAYPDLLTKCYQDSNPTGQLGPLNPTNDSTFEFLKNLFTEVTSRFHDTYIHLGGNEINGDCWLSNPEIVEFMQKMGFPGIYSELVNYYVSKVVETVKSTADPKTAITPILYQEVLDYGYQGDENTVIHVWKTADWQGYTRKATEKNFNVIISGDWNLNDLRDENDWVKYYKQNIREFGG
ncbi:unnamed protein product [Trichobilharzia szidati]|nr:unnamed protein product [Trichobilharzia szidati]